MCGIFGILQHNSQDIPSQHGLEESARLIQHRGPDYTGIYSEPGVGLVHTRLSLLDLSPRSHQPFWDRTKRYCLVYNGEVYNFQELRAELESQGIEFRGSSDTEVVLECLIHYGLAPTLPKLEGMFAFALYDKQEQTLSLARDQFGIKPLHFYEGSSLFLFSSEIQSMRPWITLEPDFLTTSAYLDGCSGGPMRENTFYQNVKKLPPGTFLTLRKGYHSDRQPFHALGDLWDPPFHQELTRCTASQIADRFEEQLLKSVKMELAADAPVGGLCSGGVDSSLILAMAARFHNNLGVFHANVVGHNSEYPAAVALAKHLKLDLHAVEVCDQDFVETMPEVMKHYGQPFSYHPNSPPFFLVSHLIRKHHVKAVLSGEGADECYFGYPWLIPNIRQYIGLYKTPATVFCFLRDNFKRLLGRNGSSNNTYRPSDLNNRFENIMEKEEIRRIVQKTSSGKTYEKIFTALDQFRYHLRTLLHRNDTLGMAAGIEARFPYLDSSLVKLAINMPYNCKVRFSPTTLDKSHYFLMDKWVLRTVAARYLPKELSHRKKLGFPTSAQNRLKVKPEYFKSSFIAGLFKMDKKEMNYMMEHADQKLKQKLLHLEVWGQVCILGESEGKTLIKLKEYTTIAPSAV
jgi:asparagine synthase (glutamine-hydrolysing)